MEIHIHDRYTFEGKSEEVVVDKATKKSIIQWVKELIQKFVDDEVDFVLEKLKHIFVAKNYIEELYAFQKEKGLVQGHTKNGLAEGFAMALSYKNHLGEEERVLFFRAEIIFGMYYKNEKLEEEIKDQVWMPYNIFFHELCHINDDYQIKKYIKLDEVDQFTVLPKYLYPISFSMWEEYYAYRKAAERFPYGDLMISHLVDAEKWAFDEVIKVSKKYREDNNISECMIKFREVIKYYLRAMVSVAGNVHGYSADSYQREGLFELTLDQLKHEGSKIIFIQTVIELDQLFIEYPTWNGLSRLGILNDIVLAFFNAFGVYPKEVDNDQMYIDFK